MQKPIVFFNNYNFDLEFIEKVFQELLKQHIYFLDEVEFTFVLEEFLKKQKNDKNYHFGSLNITDIMYELKMFGSLKKTGTKGKILISPDLASKVDLNLPDLANKVILDFCNKYTQLDELKQQNNIAICFENPNRVLTGTPSFETDGIVNEETKISNNGVIVIDFQQKDKNYKFEPLNIKTATITNASYLLLHGEKNKIYINSFDIAQILNILNQIFNKQNNIKR